MKSKANLDRHENLENFGLDIESELTSMLSDELSKSIDAEIMRKLFLLVTLILSIEFNNTPFILIIGEVGIL